MNDKLREALEDFEGKVEGWAAAYPLTIFREPSDEELKNAHEALKTVGLTLDVLSASAMRYVATSLAAHFLPVRQALAASEQEPQAQAGEPDNYKAWYEDAMHASNEAGYAGYDAAATIRAMSASIANYRAALKACVSAMTDAILSGKPANTWEMQFAVTQAEEAMK